MNFAPQLDAPQWRHDDPFLDRDPPLRQVIRLLRRRRGLLVACALAGAVLGGGVGMLIPARYTATAELGTQPQLPVLAGGQVAAIAPPEDEATIESYKVALTSRSHLERVIASLGRDPVAKHVATPPERPTFLDTQRQALTVWLTSVWATASRPVLNFLGPTHRPDRANASPSASDKAAALEAKNVEAFKRHLLVFQEEGSDVLGVSFSSINPQEASRAANRVAQLYADTLYDQKRETTERTLVWIGKRIPELKQEIDQAERAAQLFRTEHGLAQGNQTDPIDDRLADLSRRTTAAEAALDERKAQLAAAGGFGRGRQGTDAFVPTADSSALRDLRDHELALLQTKAELSTTLGAMNPRTRAIDAQLAAVRARMAGAAHQAGNDLQAQIRAASLQLGTLRTQLAAAQARSNEARETEAHLQDLERSAATKRQVYESLLQRREALIEQKEMISPDVRILSLARPPDRPSSINPLLFPFPAMIVFLIGGALVAIVQDRLDQGLRSARDVAETLGIPCVGLVPKLRRSRRMRPHQHLLSNPYGPYGEAIRSIAASLQLAAPNGLPQTVLISSSIPREGKTTLAISLAVYAAMIGRRVILVDLDFRRPTIWREIGRKGLAGLLPEPGQDSSSLKAIETVPQLGIDVLPICRRREEPLRAFADGELSRLLVQLRTRYDCIVVDGPPLLVVTEARLLARLVDKVLFLVKWESTRKDMAQNALALLHETGNLPGAGDPANIPRNGLSLTLGTRALELVREKMVAAVVTQVDMKKHARFHYGDVGESFVRYAKYYADNSALALGNKPARLPEFVSNERFGRTP